jgi:hypothetical protein
MDTRPPERASIRRQERAAPKEDEVGEPRAPRPRNHHHPHTRLLASPLLQVTRLIKLAATPAPKPLSIFTTVTPAAQELSIASRAASPPKLAP